MPVIVIGADTPLGEAIIDVLATRDGEIRAFVSHPSAAKRLRNRGIKVATGDVSDGSHVGSAAAGCFAAVAVPEAAFDARERSFSRSPAATITVWSSALSEASITRLIWLEDPRAGGAIEEFRGSIAEVVAVATEGRTPGEIATDVARFDDLDSFEDV